METNVEKAIDRLIFNWERLVAEGDFTEEEMVDSLTEQVDAGSQGWDSSMDELDADPELYNIMGYGDDLTNEQADEWTNIVVRAAMGKSETKEEGKFMTVTFHPGLMNLVLQSMQLVGITH